MPFLIAKNDNPIYTVNTSFVEEQSQNRIFFWTNDDTLFFDFINANTLSAQTKKNSEASLYLNEYGLIDCVFEATSLLKGPL